MANLRRRLMALPRVQALTPSQQEALVAKLYKALKDYGIASRIRPTLKRPVGAPERRGRKPAIEKRNLLSDCADAWKELTGRNGLWVRGEPGPAVELATAVLGAAHGTAARLFVADLKRQVDSARKLRKDR